MSSSRLCGGLGRGEEGAEAVEAVRDDAIDAAPGEPGRAIRRPGRGGLPIFFCGAAFPFRFFAARAASRCFLENSHAAPAASSGASSSGKARHDDMIARF